MSAATLSRVGATIALLRSCQARRAAGHPVYLTTDPAWLLDMAINRRAGWAEDLHSHGSVQPPVPGRFPRYATGDAQAELSRLTRDVNTPRLVVRLQSIGIWRRYLAKRLPERLS